MDKNKLIEVIEISYLLNDFNFTKWIIEQTKDNGFYLLDNNLFRYKYTSPYTLSELYNIYNKEK